jgi:two-component system NtrC family sensor kinase
MILASLTSATRTSRLIACSQLACVVLFGSLLLAPWRALSPTLGATFILASVAFALAAVSIARGAAGLMRLVFVAFALLAMLAGFGEAWLLFVPASPMFIALQELSSLELVVAMAALNGATAEEMQSRVSAEQLLKASLEQRVVQRTLELDDAQRVLHRMWWLGQQITLELDPRRVLERFLEAAADVAQADGATLGLLADDSMIELTAASGVLASLAGDKVSVTGSAMGRIIRSGGNWCVADVRDHQEAVERSWFERAVDPVRGMAVVPVQRRGERVGAVVIVSTQARTFSLLELERVEAMADLLSVALANAELFQTMKQAEWRFRTLFRAAPDAVLTVLHATGRIREANDAVREVFGLEPHQVIGKTLVELLLAADGDTMERALAAAFAGTPARVEVQVAMQGGATRVVALSASRLPEADPPSVLLIGRDMTQERELRVRLMESDRLAAVGELVAGVAHEVNNPLSSISAFAQLLLRESTLTPSQRESIDVIRTETIRASQVVKDLLAFARRSEPHRAPLDINSVVSRTVRMRQYQFAEASVRVETELAEELPSVMGDARQLQQVCLNLLTNSVQAMTATGGGVLRVRSYAVGDAVRLEVSDSGTGISPSARAHIFEPFFTTKKEGEGTGLGLSVSYGIVTAHGGTIEVAETSATGSVFRVTLPSVTAPPSDSDGTSNLLPFTLRSPLAGIRLLFVDDEAALRIGMEAFGVLRGFSVVSTPDGVSALEAARTSGVDAVVCDLRMPGMDGYAFHEQLRRERPGLAARTVFITGDVVSPQVRGSVSRQPVLTKPFSFELIEEALIAVMRGTPYVPGERVARAPA